MPTPGISAFRAATREFERKRPPVAQFWYGTPLQDLIKVETITGEPIREQVKYLANSSGGFYAPDGNLDIPTIQQKYTQVEYDWKLATKSYALPRYKISANAGSQQRLFDLWLEERLDAEASLRENVIEPALFGPDTSGPIDTNTYLGLRAIGDNDNTATMPALGKLLRSDAPAWAAIRDTSTHFMSEQFLEEAYQLTAWLPRQANCMPTSNRLYTKYILGLAPRRRYESNEKKWEGGVQSSNGAGGWMPFHSAKLFKANGCPTGVNGDYLFILQTEGPVDIHSHKERASWIYLAALKGEWMTSQHREYPMREDSERVSARVVAYGAMVCTERRSQQMYTDVR